MTWGFKLLETITQPSVTAFATLDPTHPEGMRPTELLDYYTAAADLNLPESVPQQVRDYFDAARMLWVYGWFYYPFYSLANVHSGFCVEMALKERFRREGLVLSRTKRTLENMLAEAIQRRWIVPEGFAAIRRRKDSEDYWAEMEAEDTDDPEGIQKIAPSEEASRLEDGMRRLIDSLRHFRNMSAHPKAMPVRLPGMAYAQLEFVSDLIGQLFVTGP